MKSGYFSLFNVQMTDQVYRHAPEHVRIYMEMLKQRVLSELPWPRPSHMIRADKTTMREIKNGNEDSSNELTLSQYLEIRRKTPSEQLFIDEMRSLSP